MIFNLHFYEKNQSEEIMQLKSEQSEELGGVWWF